jgi:hypothetical protein
MHSRGLPSAVVMSTLRRETHVTFVSLDLLKRTQEPASRHLISTALVLTTQTHNLLRRHAFSFHASMGISQLREAPRRPERTAVVYRPRTFAF